MDRDEILADLLHTYKEELAILTDDELLQHWQIQKRVSSMSIQELEEWSKQTCQKM